MEVKYGNGTTKYGLGVQINLTGDEVAIAISAYLVAHGVYINGPRTIKVNGQLCENGSIYVDPSGFANYNGKQYKGSETRETLRKMKLDELDEYKNE